MLLTQEPIDASGQPSDEIGLPRLESWQVDTRPIDGEALGRPRVGSVVPVGELDERLARNAPDPDTRPAQTGLTVAFDQHHVAPQLNSMDRCSVATWTTSDDEEVDPFCDFPDDH
jgi:hypothetical protein